MIPPGFGVSTCCKALRDNLNPWDSEAKGLAPIVALEVDGKALDSPQCTGFTYRKQARSQGTMLNHCPLVRQEPADVAGRGHTEGGDVSAPAAPRAFAPAPRSVLGVAMAGMGGEVGRGVKAKGSRR